MSETPTKKFTWLSRVFTLAITCALILGALALVVYRDKLNLDALERWLTYRQLETGETGQALPFTYAGGDDLSMAFLDSGILFSGGEGAHYYAINGQPYAEQVLSMDHPVLTACRKSGVVYDAGGQALFLFREGQQAMTLDLEGNADLLSARANDAGWLAVTAQQSGYKGAVTVCDDQGEKAMQISLSSTFVVDAAPSPNNKSVAVVTIDQRDGGFHTTISFYPLDRTEPSATLDLGNVMVLDMDYESDRLWLLCDDRLLTTDPSGTQITSYLFGGRYLKGYDLKGDGFALLLLSSYASGNADLALTLDSSCSPLGQLPLTGQILDFDCAGGYTALLSGDELTLYDRLFTTYALLSDTQGARYVSLRGDGSAALANRQQCWLFIPT